MSKGAFAHPYRTVRRLLLRIRDRRLRAAAIFAVAFAINLAAGRIVETVFSPTTFARALAAQQTWLARLEEFSPLALGRGYLADVGPALRGDIVYTPPPPTPPGPSGAEVTAALEADARRLMACAAARADQLARSDCTRQLPPGPAGQRCVTSPTTPGCEAYRACVEAIPAVRALPPECEAVPSPTRFGLPTPLGGGAPTGPVVAASQPGAPRIPAIFGPIVGLVRTVTRLFSGGWAAVVPLAQLALGALLTALLLGSARPGDSFGMLIGAPLMVVLLGSVAALVLQWLMLGALFAFAWVTQLAAAAAGATGLVGGCWYCVAKLAEKGVEGALTGRAG